MTIHEFGRENQKVIVLVHPSIVMWDYFQYVIPLMEKKYHLIIPAIPGYDPDVKNDFQASKRSPRNLRSGLPITASRRSHACTAARWAEALSLECLQIIRSVFKTR